MKRILTRVEKRRGNCLNQRLARVVSALGVPVLVAMGFHFKRCGVSIN